MGNKARHDTVLIRITSTDDDESVGEYTITDWRPEMEDTLDELAEKHRFGWEFVGPGEKVTFEQFKTLFPEDA